MILKTAFLSLISHRNRSVLILVILSISACLTLLGFAITHTIEQNMRKSLTDSISGDILIYNSNQDISIDILEASQSINPIEEYSDVVEILSNTKEVESFTPLNKGSMLLNNPMTEEYTIPIQVIGANIKEYMDIFKKVTLVEGTLIPEGEKGLLLSKNYIDKAKERILKMAEDMKNNPPEKKGEERGNRPDFPAMGDDMLKNILDKVSVGSKIKVSSNTFGGSQRITELTIYGIIETKGITDIASQYSLIDLKTYQEMVEYNPESNILTVEQKKALERNKEYFIDFKVENEEEKTGSFDESSIENLFDNMVEEETAEYSDNAVNIDDYRKVDEKEMVSIANDTGKTDFIVLRLTNSNLIDKVAEDLNKTFANKDLSYKAISYIESSSSLGGYISLANIIISTIIFIIQIISIIIITNSILTGVMDRTNEIGTMRAIGANKSYIFKLLLGESFIISVVSSIIGAIIGLIIILIVGLFGIQATDIITTMLFGGSKLYLEADILGLLFSFVLIVVVSLISTIYPLIFSTKITPLEAMNKI